jgi:GTP-binding protein HflX
MQLEIDRRLVREKVADLKERIAQVQARKSREVKERKRQHFTISLVGYTNAGKSTLFNTLTGDRTFVEDKLFATLDTKTRRWHLGGTSDGRDHGGGGAHAALISDTVGFVRDLPHHLVASFKATLEEATHADMLLLVLDVSHPHAQQQLRTVVQTLKEIGCQDIPSLLVLNKIDALDAHSDEVAFWKSMFPDALPASALQGQGIVTLTDVVRDQMLGRTLQAAVSIPLVDPKGITFVEKFSDVKERDYDSAPGSVVLTADVSQRIIDQLPNNVPSAKVLRARTVKGKAGSAWRLRTRPIKDLIPDGFLESQDAGDKAMALGLPGPAGAKPAAGAGLSIGRRRLGMPSVKPF